MNSQFNSPAGLTDYWNGAVKIRDYISAKLSNHFQSFGYSRIEFPLLERQDYFSVEMVGSNPWPGWHPKSLVVVPLKNYGTNYNSLPDSTENMVLIPEGTTSFCRWIAARVEEDGLKIEEGTPLRAYYDTPCFRNELTSKVSATKQRQFTQIGLELLGASSVHADIEVIYIMAKSLERLGFQSKNIRVRISDVRIFNYLIKKHGISAHVEYQIKDTLDAIASARAKQNGALEESIAKFEKLLDYAKLDEDQKLEWLPVYNSEYLRPADLDSLEGKFPKGLIQELLTATKALTELGVEIYCDLSVVRSQEYYTALTFQLDFVSADKLLAEVAGGGRYDNFVSNFLRRYGSSKQKNIAGTGFAFSLERLVELWKHFNSKPVTNDPILYNTRDNRIDKVVYSQDFVSAIKSAETLVAKRELIELYVADKSKDHAIEYAQSLNVELFQTK